MATPNEQNNEVATVEKFQVEEKGTSNKTGKEIIINNSIN